MLTFSWSLLALNCVADWIWDSLELIVDISEQHSLNSKLLNFLVLANQHYYILITGFTADHGTWIFPEIQFKVYQEACFNQAETRHQKL